MARRVKGVSYVPITQPVVFLDPQGNELPALALIVRGPSYPVVLKAGQDSAINLEGLLLTCLQVLHMLRLKKEQTILGQAGVVVPPGVTLTMAGDTP